MDEHDLEGLLERHRRGDEAANARLLTIACLRLERQASRMLARFPDLRRWAETGDVLQGSMIRLQRALAGTRLESVRHFFNLGGEVIRRELLDLAKSLRGPNGLGNRHHSDGCGRAADDPGQPLACHAQDGEPQTLEAWQELYELVEKLPADLREVFDLLAFQQMPQPEAAALLGVDPRTVKRKWSRAKVLLAQARQESDDGR